MSGKRGTSWYSQYRLIFGLRWNAQYREAADFGAAREDVAGQVLRMVSQQSARLLAPGGSLGMPAMPGETDRCHIIAKANGGTDHPDNVIPALDASLNRSLGRRGDHIMAAIAGLRQTVKAVRASFPHYSELQVLEKAQALYIQGRRAFRVLLDQLPV